MTLVIDTYNDYFFYLQYRRGVKPATVKANKLALRYFSSLYGYMDTEKLLAVHIIRFRQSLEERKREQRNAEGEYLPISEYSIYKVMVKLRAYVRWLESERLLCELKPIDVPIGNVPCPLPKFLTKQEIQKIFEYLDESVCEVERNGTKIKKYYTYLYRAIAWFLYTTGVRNAELRNLKISDVNFHQLTGRLI